MQNKVNRRRSRAVAMELLYSGTLNKRSEDLSDEYLAEFSQISDSQDALDFDYIRRSVELAETRDAYIRSIIRPYLKDWDMDRISRVNLAILRISATELLFMADDIPERVSVNEAIELTRTYSDEQSTSFINGVLDKILKAKRDETLPNWSEYEGQNQLERTEETDSAEEPVQNDRTVISETGDDSLV